LCSRRERERGKEGDGGRREKRKKVEKDRERERESESSKKDALVEKERRTLFRLERRNFPKSSHEMETFITIKKFVKLLEQ
jgi:hypothetical protein